jgi:hypothetical protein
MVQSMDISKTLKPMKKMTWAERVTWVNIFICEDGRIFEHVLDDPEDLLPCEIKDGAWNVAKPNTKVIVVTNLVTTCQDRGRRTRVRCNHETSNSR